MRSRKQSNSAYDIGREIAELERGMNELGIRFNHSVFDKFKTYLEVLYSYHGKMHLLSHRDYERISRRHFLPSLLTLPFTIKHKRVCDVGSGAGFPSVPLKILSPHLDLVIFEAQRKKADFLNYLMERLDLEGVEIVNGRAEIYSGVKFDLALLRAVGKINKLIGVLDLLLEPGGAAIFFKTLRVEKEIGDAQKALQKHNFRVLIRKTLTPLDKSPLALVTLRKS
jgi:16S rRNA (guanine527-N7)-methyltransferase